MYFQHDIDLMRSDEKLALELLKDPNQPEPVHIACITQWQSCALHCFNQSMSYPLMLAAVKAWPSCSAMVLDNPEQEDLLIGCTMHHSHAVQLINHPNPNIRAGCAFWQDLAPHLQDDPVNWVRNICHTPLTLKYGASCGESDCI